MRTKSEYSIAIAESVLQQVAEMAACSYWGFVDGYDTIQGPDGIPEYRSVTFTETGDGDIEVSHTVTLDNITTALNRIRREDLLRADLMRQIRNADADQDPDIDADVADLAFQIAALGEVRYG